MASKIKCIYKSKYDNGDPEFLISPCFSISSNVELKEIPTTGEEYLLKVMKERENIAVVTRCTKDYSKCNNKTFLVNELPSAKLAPEKLKPTIEWQNIQVADFSEVRMYVSRLRTKHADTIRDLEVDINNLSRWKKYFNNTEPTLSNVIGMRQSVLDNGIEFLTQMLEEINAGDTIDHKTGQWIYAFLACSRHPLLSDSLSILRDLARKCAEIRSHINPETENALEAATPLNIFICLVARYFGQYDLAD